MNAIQSNKEHEDPLKQHRHVYDLLRLLPYDSTYDFFLLTRMNN